MKKVTFLLFGILLLFSSNYSYSQTALTDANIHAAVDLWISDEITAETTYGHISDWDTSNITNMSNLFASSGLFNDDISSWDVSNVIDMSWMFYDASEFNQSIDSWDVSSVTTMRSMFESNFTFNQPIGSWDVSNVADMSSMFYEADQISNSIGNWNVSNVTDMSHMFEQSYINPSIGYWDVSSVINMSRMFSSAHFFNGDINNWDVSNVTNMAFMFSGDEGAFNSPINNWDVSSVNNMGGMFSENAVFTRYEDLGQWDIKNVTSMDGMFWNPNGLTTAQYDTLLIEWASLDNLQSNVNLGAPGSNYCYGETARNYIINTYGWTITDSGLDCPSLMPITDTNINNAVALWLSDQAAAQSMYGHISNWDTSNVTNMSNLFEDTNFNQPIGNWDVSNVTDMSYMFYRCASFNQDISGWNVGNVTTMNAMFGEADNFNQAIGNWNVSNVTNMRWLFERSGFNQNISNWDVSSVTTMSAMFFDTSFNQPIGNWDVSNVTSMSGMFEMALSFNQPIGNWDVSNVTTMSGMFRTDGTETEFNESIGNWNVSSVTNMREMFKGTFLNLDISNWDVSNVTTMEGMFEEANSFNQDISNWDVSSVTNMSNMFNTADDFNQDISNWDVSNVVNMSSMFLYATKFNQPIGNWNVSNVTDMELMMFGTFLFSTQNYDNLLIGWGTQTLQPNVIFSADLVNYCNGETSRDYIIDNFNWTITDGGLDCSSAYALGDGNIDNAVNVLDILGTVDYIFGNPPAVFNFDLTDVNSDDTINVLDVLGIQDIILNISGRTSDTDDSTEDNLVGDNYFTVTNDGFTPNTSESIEINLENEDIVKGFQFDFVLPEGFTFNPADITGTTRLDGFNISAQEVSANTYRVIAYSLSSATVVEGTTGALNIPVFIESNVAIGTYPIAFTDVIISDTNNTDISTAPPMVGEITISTLDIDNPENHAPQIKLYPNPVQNILNIDSGFEGVYEMNDVNGRSVGNGTILLGKTKIETSNLQSGLYFIKVSNNRGEVIKKFIKR